MAERNPYPASSPIGARPGVRQFAIKAAASWVFGALLKLTSGELEEAAADPVAVVGIALAGSVDSHALTPNLAEVYLADGSTEFSWPFSGGTPVVGTEYGVVKTSSVWYLDVAEVTTKVLKVTRLDPLTPTTRCYAHFSTVTTQG